LHIGIILIEELHSQVKRNIQWNYNSSIIFKKMECRNKYLLTLYDNDELDIKRRYQMIMGLPRIQGN